MKVLILDDELKSREVLRALLQLYCPEVTSTILCASISEAIVAIEQHNPEVLFLDISLREGDSFQLLEQLGGFDGGIAFITAYDEFSVRALRFCKIPCLMKPIEIEKLHDEIELHKNIAIGYAQALRGEGISSSDLKERLKTKENGLRAKYGKMDT
jgi:two-component system LytT family response regulator